MLAPAPLALLLTALTVTPAKPEPEVRGRQLFNYPGLGKNGVSCADCHSTLEEEDKDGDGLIRAGHSLWGVANRPSWRGDLRRATHPTLKEAADVCVQLFQGGLPLEVEDARVLLAYLSAISPKRPQPAIQIQPGLEANLDYHRERYQGGDTERGRKLFFRACNGCHPRGGAGLGTALSGTQPADVARAIREGNGLLRGSRRAGAWMPFFGRDRLNDQQVADLSAFVGTMAAESPPPPPAVEPKPTAPKSAAAPTKR